MRILVLLGLACTCAAAPVSLQPLPYVAGPAIAFTSSLTPAVTKIQSPGIKLHFPAAVQYVAPTPVVPAVGQPVVQAVAQPVVQAVAQPVVQAVAQPITYQADAVVAPVPVASPVVVAAAPEPLNAPNPPMPSVDTPFVGGQFHSQDELKQYTFGHYGGPNTRVETRDSLGRTHGSFAYVNPDGDVQVRKYAAAPAMGFKVAASDLPDDTPEVARLKAVHEKTSQAIKDVITASA